MLTAAFLAAVFKFVYSKISSHFYKTPSLISVHNSR